MTIRELINKMDTAVLDAKIDVSAWRRDKRLSNEEKAYLRGYICGKDNQAFNSLTPVIQIPDTGASIRELMDKLISTELDKEIDIVAWRQSKGLPASEKAFFRLFIQRKNGKNYILVASTVIKGGNDQNKKTDSDVRNIGDNKWHNNVLYIPTKDDCIRAIESIKEKESAKLENIPIEDILNQIENNVEKSGKKLSSDWRLATKKKIIMLT